jgi:hypothetical protein
MGKMQVGRASVEGGRPTQSEQNRPLAKACVFNHYAELHSREWRVRHEAGDRLGQTTFALAPVAGLATLLAVVL